MLSVGNDVTRQHFAGDFLMSPAEDELPAISLVFVQSREGNTVAQNPADLGGGDTDLNLIYEGLSRVAADGVMAGARTATGRVLFSVWQPDIVDLRYALGLPQVSVVVVGIHDDEELKQNLTWARGYKPLSAAELKALEPTTQALAAKWGKVYGEVT